MRRMTSAAGTTSSRRQPWSLTPLDDRVELDRPQPGLVGGGDPSSTPRQRDAHRPEHAVVLRVEADRHARQARLAQRPRLAGQQRPVGGQWIVISPSGRRRYDSSPPTASSSMASCTWPRSAPPRDGGRGHGSAPRRELLPPRRWLGARGVVGASFGVPLAVLVSSHRPRLPARYDDHAVGATWIGPTLSTFARPVRPNPCILACRGPLTAYQRDEWSPRTGLTHHAN
jgi:hypothetical protein